MAYINYIASTMIYGNKSRIISFNASGIEIIFSVVASATMVDGKSVIIEKEKPSIAKVSNIERIIGKEILKSRLVLSNDEKEETRVYNLIQFVMDNIIVTVGEYFPNRSSSNKIHPKYQEKSFLLCTADNISIFEKGVEIVNPSQLDDTDFDIFKCIFDKKEMAKLLLRT